MSPTLPKRFTAISELERDLGREAVGRSVRSPVHRFRWPRTRCRISGQIVANRSFNPFSSPLRRSTTNSVTVSGRVAMNGPNSDEGKMNSELTHRRREKLATNSTCSRVEASFGGGVVDANSGYAAKCIPPVCSLRFSRPPAFSFWNGFHLALPSNSQAVTNHAVPSPASGRSLQCPRRWCSLPIRV